jgi:hypothetical protein
MTGGKKGCIVCGIIVAIFFNVIVAPGTEGNSPIAFRIVFAILSISSIPVAVIGQKISQKIYSLLHGKDTASVYVSTSLKDVIMHKFIGAIIAPVISNSLLLIILMNILWKSGV